MSCYKYFSPCALCHMWILYDHHIALSNLGLNALGEYPLISRFLVCCKGLEGSCNSADRIEKEQFSQMNSLEGTTSDDRGLTY